MSLAGRGIEISHELSPLSDVRTGRSPDGPECGISFATSRRCACILGSNIFIVFYYDEIMANLALSCLEFLRPVLYRNGHQWHHCSDASGQSGELEW